MRSVGEGRRGGGVKEEEVEEATGRSSPSLENKRKHLLLSFTGSGTLVGLMGLALAQLFENRE